MYMYIVHTVHCHVGFGGLGVYVLGAAFFLSRKRKSSNNETTGAAPQLAHLACIKGLRDVETNCSAGRAADLCGPSPRL